MSEEQTRTVLVTGSTSGIGKAIATRLLDAGHSVIGLGRDHGKFVPESSRYSPVTTDLSDLDHLPGHLQAVQEQFPNIDVVISNAGTGRFGELEQFSHAQIREMIDINLTSHLLVARSFLPALKRKRRGDLLLMGSEAALRGRRKGSVYSAAKFALRGLGQSLREECAKSGVRVTVVHPGMVRTQFYEELDFEPGEADVNALTAEDVAEIVFQVLSLRAGAVVDEITISPLTKVLRSKPRDR